MVSHGKKPGQAGPGREPQPCQLLRTLPGCDRTRRRLSRRIAWHRTSISRTKSRVTIPTSILPHTGEENRDSLETGHFSDFQVLRSALRADHPRIRKFAAFFFSSGSLHWFGLARLTGRAPPLWCAEGMAASDAVIFPLVREMHHHPLPSDTLSNYKVLGAAQWTSHLWELYAEWMLNARTSISLFLKSDPGAIVKRAEARY